MVDPQPDKGGIVRDSGLRQVLRQRLKERNLNPDAYSKSELQQSTKVKDLDGKAGGLSLALTHVLEPEVPPENVVAFFDECDEV